MTLIISLYETIHFLEWITFILLFLFMLEIFFRPRIVITSEKYYKSVNDNTLTKRFHCHLWINCSPDYSNNRRDRSFIERMSFKIF